MKSKPILNKISLWAHIKSEFDVFGVPKKLVNYVVHLSKRKISKNLFFFTEAAQTAIDQFLDSRNFRD
jgi:acid phosphatase class B